MLKHSVFRLHLILGTLNPNRHILAVYFSLVLFERVAISKYRESEILDVIEQVVVI